MVFSYLTVFGFKGKPPLKEVSEMDPVLLSWSAIIVAVGLAFGLALGTIPGLITIHYHYHNDKGKKD